jgi:hypothetical protein
MTLIHSSPPNRARRQPSHWHTGAAYAALTGLAPSLTGDDYTFSHTNRKLFAGIGTRSSKVSPTLLATASQSAMSRMPHAASRCRREASNASLLGAVNAPSTVAAWGEGESG